MRHLISHSILQRVLACLACAFLYTDVAGAADDSAHELAAARAAWKQTEVLEVQARKLRENPDAKVTDLIDVSDQTYLAFREAEAHFRKALGAVPPNAEGKAEFARFVTEFLRFLYSQQQFVEATKEIQSLVNSSASAALPAPDVGRLWRLLGALHEQSGRLYQACDAYKHAQEADPTNPKNVLERAVALNAWESPEEAAQILKVWLDKPTPCTAEELSFGWYTYGYALELSGRLGPAQDAYKQARLTAEKALDEGTVSLAEQARFAVRRLRYLERKLAADVPAALSTPAFLSPKSLSDPYFFMNGAQRYSVACEFQRVGLEWKRIWVRSRRAYEEQREWEFDLPLPDFARDSLGTYWPMGPYYDLGPAVVALRAAVTISPELARANRELGHCYLIMSDYKSARSYLELASLNDPLSPTGLLNVAEARMNMGDYAAAREALEKLLGWAPNFGPAHLRIARAISRTSKVERDLDDALDEIDHAQQVGVEVAVLAPVRRMVLNLRIKAERGEKLPGALAAAAAQDAPERSNNTIRPDLLFAPMSDVPPAMPNDDTHPAP